MKLVSKHDNRDVITEHENIDDNNIINPENDSSPKNHVQPIKLHTSEMQISIHPDVPHLLAQKQIRQATQQPGSQDNKKTNQQKSTQSPIQFLESSQKAASFAPTLSAAQEAALKEAAIMLPQIAPKPVSRQPRQPVRSHENNPVQIQVEHPPEQLQRQTRQKQTQHQQRRPQPQQRKPQPQTQAQKSRQIQKQKPQAKTQPVKRKHKTNTKHIVLIIILIITLSAAGFAGWYYWWTTHATFDYILQPIVILQGQNVEANDFMIRTEETENISASFRRSGFRPAAGQQQVPLTLTLGWRSLEANAALFVLTPGEPITHEFKEPGYDLKAIEFISNASLASDVPFDVRFIEEPDLLENYPVGEHILRLSMNNAPFEIILNVVDTTPPTAAAVNKSIIIGDSVTPNDFITDVYDASGVQSVSFVEEPDLSAHFDQIVQIKIEDIYGNYDIFNAALTIQLDNSPPLIEGTDTIVSQAGVPILYRQGVTAHDSFGRPLELEVNSTEVDQYTVGVYTAFYRATDMSGQVTEISVEVDIIDVDIDEINRRVDDVLFGRNGIIRDNMTEKQMVLAIHRWVRWNVYYAAVRGGPRTAYEGAEIALRERRGNCYIFYSISEVLLTRAGIENMRIERIEGTPTRHRWNLVNPDGEGWYHYDSFPTRLGLGDELALFTSTQADDFSERISLLGGLRQYFTYDPSKYPGITQ